MDRRGAIARAVGAALAGAGAAAWLTGCAGWGRESDASLFRPPKGPLPMPEPPRAAEPFSPGWSGQVLPRSAWAKAEPMPARMDPMMPVRRITIHHTAVPASSIRTKAQAAAMVERIRRDHVTRPGEPFGDIGYHYVIDPLGNVWEGRPLRWQGAHVAKQNEGNLGIVCLGNFELERPTAAQVSTLTAFTQSQMRRFGVSIAEVRTHREMARTACPGKNLQPIINLARAPGGAMRLA